MFPTDSGLEFEFSMEKEATPVVDDPPFRILLLGDYSGRENLARTVDSALPKTKPFEVDRDTFEDAIKKLNVSLRLHLHGNEDEPLLLSFSELDDFHPDNIFRQVSLFSDLRKLRKQLLDPETFDQAAREINSWFEADDQNDEGETEDQEDVEAPDFSASSGNLLDDILGGQTKAEARTYKQRGSSLLGDFVRDVVSPHIVQTDEAEQARLLALVDSATSDLMREILRHPEFKALEAAWRGLYFLVRRVETNSDLKISLLDISKKELELDLQSVTDLTDSELYKTLITETIQTHGGEPWAVVCGNYEFKLSVEDAATVIRLAKLSSIAKAPFISCIGPQMLGVESMSQGAEEGRWNPREETSEGKLWTTLRTIPEATSIGFATPRFLGRLPYGKDTEPTEVFDFEEFRADFEHEDYLWLNPSFACATLLAQSFSESGWEMGRSLILDLDGLPVHIYPDDGETRTKPCAEIPLTHAACDLIIEQGLMPVISFLNEDRIRLGGFHSIAFPAKALNGRWG